ncbi:MAG: type II toxin-antitoxin system VapB family antitoxin [Actinocrinis sp.]
MTKILVDVDDTVLAEAMELLGTKTKKETINLALREITARRRRIKAFHELCELFDSGDNDFECIARVTGQPILRNDTPAQFE